MRLIYSLKNVSISWFSQIISLLIKFIARSFFIYFLSKEYLGLNGLFSNVLSMLSLAELGVGSAIVYSLYRPISNNDEDDILAIMSLYKCFYIFIGIFILVFGCVLTPFLSFFIKDMPDISNIKLIYVLYVINSSISYFFSYKSTFITANQKDYIVVTNKLIFTVFLNIFQIIGLFFTHSFILYLLIQIIFTLLENIFISQIADRIYPVLKSKKNVILKSSIKQEIIKNTGAMIFHKIGSIVVFSSDNLILSKMVGLVSVGIYSNYSLVITAIDNVIKQVFNSLVATIGNLRLNSSVNKQIDIYFSILFLNFLIYSFFSLIILTLLNDFIILWVGKSFLFSFLVLFVLVLNFYITGMRKCTSMFKDAYGLFWHNRYMPIIESILNIIFSIILTHKFGIIGVFLGTFLSSIFTCVWIEPYVLFKWGFKYSVSNFWKKYLKYFVYLFIYFFASIVIFYFISIPGFFGLICKGIICFFAHIFISFILFRKSDEFIYLKEYFKNNVIKVIFNKKKISL